MTVRMNQLDQTRDGPDRGLAVPLAYMIPKSKVSIIAVSVVQWPQFVVEDLRDIIGDESEVGGKMFGDELRHLPTGQVGMPTVMKGIIITDVFWQWRQEMSRSRDGRDVTFDIAVEDDTRLSWCRS